MDTTVDRVRSKSKEDKNFALKLNERDCPMTHKNIDSCTGMKVSKRKMAPGTLEKSEAPGAF